MSVLLIPAADPTSSSTIRWRVGPGLVRVTGSVPPNRLPAPLRGLADEGVLTAISVAPGRIDTTFRGERPAPADGARVRTALYEVLSSPGGWPDRAAPGEETGAEDPADGVVSTAEQSRAADRELTAAVATILDGDFGVYTASHGGRIDLVDVHDGVVTVGLGGTCHGCAAADITLSRHLAERLRREPGFRSLRTTDDPPADTCCAN